jgi:energy-coupling factor transporter ATP-binding protein EcfA2
MGTTAADVVSEAHTLFTFIRTPAGEPYAIPKAEGALRVALSLDQAATDIAAAFYVSGDIPGQQTMSAAMTVLSAQTRNVETREVYLRLARLGTTTYLDLGTPQGQYIEITPTGWAVRDPRHGNTCPALFTRSTTTNALPVPERGGSRTDLAQMLALEPSDDRYRIAWGWLVAQVFPETARPMIYFLGSQGSGKTTRGLMLANVLEPQSEMGSVLKRSERENNPVAKSSYILTVDNMTKMSEDTSNWLCSLVTGHRVIERKLYTNSETIAYSLKRTGIFTGKIKPAGLESDAEERMIFLEFERMTVDVIRADDDLMADLRNAHPRILGAVLDDMVTALHHMPTVTTADTKGYRFVNFAKVFAALDVFDTPGYIDALTREATESLAERVFDAPDLVAILRVVAADKGDWLGTSGDMLDAMRRWQPEDAQGRTDRGVWWPATAAHLGTRLRNQQHALSLVGLRLEFKRQRTGARTFHATMAPVDVARWAQPTSLSDIEIIQRGER